MLCIKNKAAFAMREQHLKILIYKHLTKVLTKKDRRKLATFTRKHPGLPALLKYLGDEQALLKDIELWNRIDVNKDLESMRVMIQRTESVRTSRQPILKWVLSGIAAILIALVGIISSNLLVHKQQKAGIAPTTPGRDQAILTLSNGQKINLDTIQNGYSLKDHSVLIMKTNSGELTYSFLPASQQFNIGETGPIAYNTLEIPRAGQYRLILPDRSKVWLNNASSLRYPVVFAGKSREAELSGEAYFKVAKNIENPFLAHVIRNGKVITIDVLGTSFNISAYKDDDKMQTTLLSGRVKLSSSGHTELMEPGEQITANAGDSWQRRRIEQPGAVIAWTTGHFHFIHASLPDVLRQLERWYDIKVEMRIHGDLSQYSLNSVIDRTQTLSSILPNLSYGNDIKFILQGKKLIVIK